MSKHLNASKSGILSQRHLTLDCEVSPQLTGQEEGGSSTGEGAKGRGRERRGRGKAIFGIPDVSYKMHRHLS